MHKMKSIITEDREKERENDKLVKNYGIQKKSICIYVYICKTTVYKKKYICIYDMYMYICVYMFTYKIKKENKRYMKSRLYNFFFTTNHHILLQNYVFFSTIITRIDHRTQITIKWLNFKIIIES